VTGPLALSARSADFALRFKFRTGPADNSRGMPTLRSHRHARERSETGASARAQQGFTLVEIIVVIIIMLVLMGLMVTKFQSSREATYRKAAIAVALSYKDAIDAYMADNGQKPPRIGQAEWPNTTRGPVDRMLRGPSGGFQAYMKSVPEQVSDGLVSFQGSPTTARADVSYRTSGPGQYTLTVTPKANPSRRCDIGNGPTTNPACI
jgi:prepilin-type N-terminal cleavage/methylation domain-containing protein